MKTLRIDVSQLDIPLEKPRRCPDRTDSLRRVEREARA